MVEEFDAIVIGMGPGGEVAADRLLSAGKKVAVVERELIGGECGYWACIPSKTLLRGPEAVHAAGRAPGATGAVLDWRAAAEYRDAMVRHLDDSAQSAAYEERGATVVKAHATVTAPGRVDAGGRTLQARNLVIATGTVPELPALEGLGDITVWTNREAYSVQELPGSVVVVGGSAVGVETATFLAGFGVRTTLVHRGHRLLSREEQRVSELAAAQLREAGIDVVLGAAPHRATRRGGLSTLELKGSGGPREVSGDAVVFATGRRPRTDGLGLEAAGVVVDDRGAVVVDSTCRAAEGVWAVGDVTGRLPFTHVAKYQGRIVAEAILGRTPTADYAGIPRVVFSIPEIAAVGLTAGQARERGFDVEAVELDAAEALARPWTYERDPETRLGLLADVVRGVLLGAWAVGPQAGEWIHYAALAIRAELPIGVLRDQVAQFPSYHEAYLAALDLFERV
ncbi:NAD(P)/FAD-dependent oxidoreductase [Zafaria sp. Z1313]|uniref:dihydrolipoyl dehydrogenase family protein n=1 Tax=unclassified Zafaria TaxID=2828765 RepID=UPI002E78C400|nr:NAD(P)/FAD-dependent oxidoreductase [Zafaria sp. J156]MEE1619794.1 NAD(P)/FAD-dependent oxidoreductase [Zafaria sp. J156]